MPTAAERITAIEADPAASFWLKLAAAGLLKRDPLDAERDAMQLALLARELRREAFQPFAVSLTVVTNPKE